MTVRALALLLAVLMAVGAVAPTVAASPATASLVDDGAPDPELVIAAAEVVVAPPVRGELGVVAAPVAELHGRLHRGWVFRPPRGFASR